MSNKSISINKYKTFKRSHKKSTSEEIIHKNRKTYNKRIKKNNKYKQKGGSRVGASGLVGGLVGAATGSIGSYVADLDPELAAGVAASGSILGGLVGIGASRAIKGAESEIDPSGAIEDPYYLNKIGDLIENNIYVVEGKITSYLPYSIDSDGNPTILNDNVPIPGGAFAPGESFISQGKGNRMTLYEASIMCSKLSRCIGFTYDINTKEENNKVITYFIYFKEWRARSLGIRNGRRISIVDAGATTRDREWKSHLKRSHTISSSVDNTVDGNPVILAIGNPRG